MLFASENQVKETKIIGNDGMFLVSKIRINKHTQPGWLLWIIIMLPFFFAGLNELIGLPRTIRYVLDMAWLGLLVLMILKYKLKSRNGVSAFEILVWAFLLYVTLVYIVQFQSPLYFLWGVRINFRFYVAFFAFIAFLSSSDVLHYFKWFDRLFWINFVISLFQFFVLDLRGDYLGGLFGAEKGK